MCEHYPFRQPDLDWQAWIRSPQYQHIDNAAPAAILNKQKSYFDGEDTYLNTLKLDLVRNLSPQDLSSIKIGKNFMLSHDYITHNFDVNEWAAPESA